MVPPIRETSEMTLCMEKEHLLGKVNQATQGPGDTIRKMERVK